LEEGRLKQRLLGAVVLVALAVIFIPMLLSGGREMKMPVYGSNVPERPADITSIKHIDSETLNKPAPTPVNPKRIPIDHGLPEPEIVKEESKKSIVETIKDVTSTKDIIKPTIKETVWAVQVGSFSKRENALALKDKLQKHKMAAFVERLMNGSKPVYRVRVGPVLNHEQAEKLQQELLKDHKLKGLVVKHP